VHDAGNTNAVSGIELATLAEPALAFATIIRAAFATAADRAAAVDDAGNLLDAAIEHLAAVPAAAVGFTAIAIETSTGVVDLLAVLHVSSPGRRC
jgi:hypothetical protein